MMSSLETLKEFNLDNIPDLDVVVEGALMMLSDSSLPDVVVPFKRPLVIGSVNAEYTGRIIFNDVDAVFANESNFEEALERVGDIDGAVLISASGSKHSVNIAERLEELQIPAVLYTNNPDAPAGSFMEKENIRVFPKNREPYTYNTSTYLSMILAKTKEDPKTILSHIEANNKVEVDLAKFKGFTFILPPDVALIAPMLRTKFDELFGTKLSPRFFVPEEIKHAKTIVQDDAELFIYVGTEELGWGEEERKIELPLVTNGGFASALATCYHFIGQIQRVHPPYFKDNIEGYCKDISEVFGQEISPIVD